ncbi:hypothetical protein DL546_004777 [Coniochaeta pulveracea]|uniref:Glycosyl hydrolase n=1 Tax=Coniochaeta pulveracea TaxID=177199 RepID=A0A420Y6J4_9PEZI|nr:hypothetical protein DL546_004777 [Coniochaeta pulveracea]
MKSPRSISVAVLAASACATASLSFVPDGLSQPNKAGNGTVPPDLQVIDDVLEALQVMQESYFQPWLGTWPTSIDWTAAVMGSHISGALQSLSQLLASLRSSEPRDYQVKENLVATYFTQLVGYYFGQDAFAIRNEAFDDILWVVLGWLDTIQFIDLHTALHYQAGGSQTGIASNQQIPRMLVNQSWHGNLWMSAFAHRARIFWELANKGWDEKLCGGGMTWNPRLEPYKNAITNELFISASIAMYLYFPGDDNASPFADDTTAGMENETPTTTGWKPHDSRYLDAAMRTYAWLKRSGYNNPLSNNTRCDVPNGMLYTYNQGVILSGQLGLFKVTGNTSYLFDGHRLIQDVIAATGYDIKTNRPVDDISSLPPGRIPYWHGLGRAGILEDVCDVRGDCSQDSHTFKGIYFHHLTAFCAPLELVSDLAPAIEERAFRQVKEAHTQACKTYVGWIRHNAMAALLTRDAEGKFGMWWTVGLLNLTMDTLDIQEGDLGPEDPTAVDYRNGDVPDDPRWGNPGKALIPPNNGLREEGGQKPLIKRSNVDWDPNNRGRGRTVETQGGGLAVLRALWEISRHGRS